MTLVSVVGRIISLSSPSAPEMFMPKFPELVNVIGYMAEGN